MDNADILLRWEQWKNTVPVRLQLSEIQMGRELPKLGPQRSGRPYKSYPQWLEMTNIIREAILADLAEQIRIKEKAEKERGFKKSRKEIALREKRATVRKANFGMFYTFTGILATVFTVLNYHNIIFLLGGGDIELASKIPFALLAFAIAFSPYFFAVNGERGKLAIVGSTYGIEMVIYIVNLHWPELQSDDLYLKLYGAYYAIYVVIFALSLYRTFTDKNKFDTVE